jgi:hypothetical protein
MHGLAKAPVTFPPQRGFLGGNGVAG